MKITKDSKDTTKGDYVWVLLFMALGITYGLDSNHNAAILTVVLLTFVGAELARRNLVTLQRKLINNQHDRIVILQSQLYHLKKAAK